ncbi:MAG: hypothetical protein WDN00_08580 [Limisphaerales bacterium]
MADICALYTNAVNSGKYDKIFITASGTINDLGVDSNALYSAATGIYSTLKNRCPQAYVFAVGNWLGAGGRTAPDASDWAGDAILSQAAAITGIQYFSPLQANVRNAANYNIFFRPATLIQFIPVGEVMASWPIG